MAQKQQHVPMSISTFLLDVSIQTGYALYRMLPLEKGKEQMPLPGAGQQNPENFRIFAITGKKATVKQTESTDTSQGNITVITSRTKDYVR